MLLAYRVKFSDNAKTKEVRKQKVELSITTLLGPKKYIDQQQQEILKREDDEIEVDYV